MNVKGKAFMLAVCLMVAVLSVPASANGVGSVDTVSGKVQVLDDEGTAWAEFKAAKEKDGGAAGGTFHWWLADGSKEAFIEVVYVTVDEEYGWFAGKCTRYSDSSLADRWFFVAVHDGGEPGRLVDHIWWELLPAAQDAESLAKEKVDNLEVPAENKAIEDGEIVVDYRS